MAGKKKNTCYAIIAGGKDYIVDTWSECERIRDEHPRGAQYKGFQHRRDAALWLTLMLQGSTDTSAKNRGESKRSEPVTTREKKFYAVADGRSTGVFESWSEAKVQIDDVPDAMCQMFYDRDMAERWIAAVTKAATLPELAEREPRFAMCYTDGSFNAVTGVWGYGAVVFEEDVEGDTLFEFSGHGTKDAEHRNVTGECWGAVCGVKQAIALGYTKVYVCYDYQGVEMWATHKWNANNEMTQKYASIMYALGKQINIEFQKVAAHTGVRYNEMVDAIAKRACGMM